VSHPVTVTTPRLTTDAAQELKVATSSAKALAERDSTLRKMKAAVVVITENLAQEYWDDPFQAIGKRVRPSSATAWREIVGVVGNVHEDGVKQPATAVTYWPMLLSNWWDRELYGERTVAYAIRTSRLGALGFMEEVRKAVWG